MMSNESFHQVPTLQLYENSNFDLTIKLLMLYALNFKAYLSKLDVAPQVLGHLALVKD